MSWQYPQIYQSRRQRPHSRASRISMHALCKDGWESGTSTSNILSLNPYRTVLISALVQMPAFSKICRVKRVSTFYHSSDSPTMSTSVIAFKNTFQITICKIGIGTTDVHWLLSLYLFILLFSKKRHTGFRQIRQTLAMH